MLFKRFISYNSNSMLDKRIFKRVFDQYFDSIRSYIFYKCGDTELASDIAQDVFLTVWEKRHTLNLANIKALLYKIANDMFITACRKQNSHINFSKHMTSDDKPLTPDEAMHYENLKDSYEFALNEITAKQREVFLMNRNDGLKYHEIASRLELSVKTVEKHMSGALKHLKQKLLLSD